MDRRPALARPLRVRWKTASSCGRSVCDAQRRFTEGDASVERHSFGLVACGTRRDPEAVAPAVGLVELQLHDARVPFLKCRFAIAQVVFPQPQERIAIPQAAHVFEPFCKGTAPSSESLRVMQTEVLDVHET